MATGLLAAEHSPYRALLAFCNEQEISLQVDCLEETLEKSLQAEGASSLRVSILLDYTRGSRGRCCEAWLSSKAYFTVGLDKL